MTLVDLLTASSERPAPKPVGPLGTPVVAGKTSSVYRVHSYHTKVPPEGIRDYLLHYMNPGDVVLDPFCGSGMTGLAALLAGRYAILSDLSPAAVHIASNYCAPCDPSAFRAAAQRLLMRMTLLEADLYGIACPSCHGSARIEYTVWSDLLACPSCGEMIRVWDQRNSDVGGLRNLSCQRCGTITRKSAFRYVQSQPVSMSVACLSKCRRQVLEMTDDEMGRIKRVESAPVPHSVPSVEFNDEREMWRGGHRDRGIRSAADFYTPRNLRALAALKEAISGEGDGRLRSALLFAFTAIVNRASRRYQWNAKRPTNVLTGTLYVSSLNYEFNVFSLLRRKLRGVEELFRTTMSARGSAIVRQSSATDLNWLPDGSIDYVFTDPPFGSNIFYADSSFLWEAWLGDATDQSMEAVVNKSRKPSKGGKTVADYHRLMRESFEEVARVLKPGGWASIVFHNSDDKVWEALRSAIEESGLRLEKTLVFDKQQPTFKGVKALIENERVPFFDVVLSAKREVRPSRRSQRVESDFSELRRVLSAHLVSIPADDRHHRSSSYLHSLLVRTYLDQAWSMDGLNYEAAESLFSTWFVRGEHGWRLPDPQEIEEKVALRV